MEVYLDGGVAKVQRKPFNGYALSYGVVTHRHGELVELYGCTIVDGRFGDYHELMAYVEAVRYVVSEGVPPNQVNFVCDDFDLFRAFHSAHPENYNPTAFAKYSDRLRKYCAEFYDDATVEQCIKYLKGANVMKVNGHCFCMNNLRCDYLAAYARKVEVEGTAEFRTFNEWLKQGFVQYVGPEFNGNREIQRNDNGDLYFKWYAPFADMPEDQPELA
jgi:hypothetical protein